MRRTLSLLLPSAALLLSAGCNTLAGAPHIAEVVVEPKSPKPGDTLWLMVNIKDKHGVVARVEGVVVSDPRATFPLFDDGSNGDEIAGDGLWSLQALVPPHLPPGEFEVEFAAYRSDGLPVEVRDMEKKIVPLKEKVMVVVQANVVAE